MKCRVCGCETEYGNLCKYCREEIELQSLEIVNNKKQVNLNFVKHHVKNDK